jgi:hypothetical protein
MTGVVGEVDESVTEFIIGRPAEADAVDFAAGTARGVYLP